MPHIDASLPRRLHLPLHHPAQCRVDARLVAPSIALEPGHHVGVQPQRDRLLERLVYSRTSPIETVRRFDSAAEGCEFSPLRRPVFRRAAEVDLTIRRSFFALFAVRFLFCICPNITIKLYVQNCKTMFLQEHM